MNFAPERKVLTSKLTASDLTLIRGDRCLVEGLGFALDPGELLLLEGENGCGKTSLLRAIAGLLPLESGDIRWHGETIRRHRQAFHNNLVWLSHKTGLNSELNLGENLSFEAALRPQAIADAEAVFKRLSVSGLKRLPLRALSAGQQRRVALARMLLANVPLWLMDEPFTSLDEPGRQLVSTVVEEHLASGGLCIIATHQAVNIDAPTQQVELS